MMDREFRALVLTDIHHDPAGRVPADHPARRADLAAELVARALYDAANRGPVDAVIILGDVLDAGETLDDADARAAMEQIALPLRALAGEVPLLVVPGNHDGPARRYFDFFGQAPGVHEVGPYRFVTFADAYGPGDVAFRSGEQRDLLARVADQPGGPIIALQHNPMHPPIDDPYPYMLANRPEVMADYTRAGVLASISGHYHPGQGPTSKGGVTYFTAPALCEAPYRYSMVRLAGRNVEIDTHPLQGPAALNIWDTHAHTQFAYCGRGVSAAGAAARAREFGLGGICLVEHAPQLYCTKDDFFAGLHVSKPGLWKRDTHTRMDEFRAAMAPLRSDGVRIGLEVELDADGELTVRPEDRDWTDLLVAGLHFLPVSIEGLGDEKLAKEFLKACELICRGGVDILAHPLRLFRWARRPVPKSVYAPLADMLAASDTAAEINFHSNQPDPEFFEMCLARGVKLTFGSDAHYPHQAGNLGAHRALLEQVAGRAGVAPTDAPGLLWRPKPL